MVQSEHTYWAADLARACGLKVENGDPVDEWDTFHVYGLASNVDLFQKNLHYRLGWIDRTKAEGFPGLIDGEKQWQHARKMYPPMPGN